MKFAVNGKWNVSSSSFGPSAYGYLAFTLGGSVPSGGSAEVRINLSFLDHLGNNLRTPVATTLSFGAGPIAYSYSSSKLLGGGSIPSGQSVRVTGTIDFRARDPGTPCTITPLDFEMSSAPPTWTFGRGNGTFDWFDPTHWAFQNTDAADGPVNLAAIPNEAGARARFVGGAVDGTAVLTAPVTLGTLDIDEPGLSFQAGSANPFIFDTQAGAGNAVILNRNTQGDAFHQIDTPVTLNDTVEIENDCAGPLTFIQPVSGTGGIIIKGPGPVIFLASNSYSGGTTVDGGSLSVQSDGELGTGSLVVNGGFVNMSAANPFSNVNTVHVNSNGQVHLGVATPGVNYIVSDLGCISGGSAELASLNIGSSLNAGSGAMIGHTSFDTGVANNPNGILPTTPTYNFGVSTDFTAAGQSITVGSLSNSPWLGFGGDTNSHVFGAAGTATQQLTVAGSAQLVSLGSELVMNAPIVGSGSPNDAIVKRGAGLVSINSAINAFTGPTTVQSGPFAVNGNWNSTSTQVNSGAALGGTGVISGAVSFAGGSEFHPGVLNAVATFAQAPVPTIEGPGTLQTGNLTFANTTHLVFDLNAVGVAGDNDLVNVIGDLTLDGILDINDGPDFGPGTYTLFTFTGNATDNIVALGNVPDFPLTLTIVNNLAGSGGSVVLNAGAAVVPEPATLGLIGLCALSAMRRRRV
jgi:autotransporter-associated beta strand protein